MARRRSKNFFFAKLLRFDNSSQKYKFSTDDDKFDNTITSRTTGGVDSAATQQMIDSNYIKAIISGNYIQDYIDHNFLDDIIDSDYVSARSGGGGGGGAGTPTITSVSPTAFDGTSGSTITVNGTNYVVGTYVDFITSGGSEHRAAATTLVSQAQVTATTPQGFSASDGPLSVKLTTSGGTTTASNAITTGSSPSWSTGTNLGSFAKNAPVSVTVAATDPQSQPVTYTVKSGSALPTGLSLNSGTGVISGTLNYSISSNTTVSSIITASDTSSNETDRTFNFTITPTSSISMAFTLPNNLGDRHIGPTASETNEWLQANVSTHGSFDDMFSAYGTGISNQRGIYWLRANRKLRIDYIIEGASGGLNYGYRSYGAGQGRKIGGSFYTEANNYLGFMVGRRGDANFNSSYRWSATGGGGATCIFVARSGYPHNAGQWHPAAIAAGGSGVPGATSSYWTSHDMYGALPLDYPYRVGDATGGRLNAQGYRSDNYFYTSPGAGWTLNGDLWSTSAAWNRTAASMLRNASYGGQAAPLLNVTSRSLGSSYGSSYTWYPVKGGFGGGGTTWRAPNTGSGNFTYQAPGGGGGGYYGGYPTSGATEGTTSSISNLPRQYPFITYQGSGHFSTDTIPNLLHGSNNNYYGAYSYALGLETTGSYTYDGGDVDGTAPSAGQTAPGGTTHGGYWDASLPRPTDYGWQTGTSNEGRCSVTISAA